MNTLTSWLELPCRRPYLALTIAYALGYWPLLINGGIFIEDWHWQFFTREMGVAEFMRQTRELSALGFYVFKTFDSYYLLHIVSFFFNLWIGLVFYRVLTLLDFLDEEERFWLAAFAIAYPLGYSRIHLSVFLAYTQSILLFLIATLYYLKNARHLPWLLRPVLLAAFFFSFNLAALGLIYVLPVGLAYYITNGNRFSWKPRDMFRFALRHADFLLVPVFFQLWRNYLVTLPLSAPGVKVNEITPDHLRNAHILLRESFVTGFYFTTAKIFSSLRGIVNKYIVFTVFCAWIGYLLARHRTFLRGRFHRALVGLSVSLVLWVMCVLPFNLAGKFIGYTQLGDRMGILATFASAGLFYYLVSLGLSFLGSARGRLAVLTVLLALMVTRNFVVWRSYLIALVKQDAVAYHIDTRPEFATATTFHFNDYTPEYLAHESIFEATVMRGLLRQRFPADDKCASELHEECLHVPEVERSNMQHNIIHYVRAPEQFLVELNYGPAAIGGNRVFPAIWKKMFQPSSYQALLPQVLDVKITPIPPPKEASSNPHQGV